MQGTNKRKLTSKDMIKSISEACEDHLRSFTTAAAVDSGPTTATSDPWSSFTPSAVDSSPTTATNDPWSSFTPAAVDSGPTTATNDPWSTTTTDPQTREDQLPPHNGADFFDVDISTQRNSNVCYEYDGSSLDGGGVGSSRGWKDRLCYCCCCCCCWWCGEARAGGGYGRVRLRRRQADSGGGGGSQEEEEEEEGASLMDCDELSLTWKDGPILI